MQTGKFSKFIQIPLITYCVSLFINTSNSYAYLWDKRNSRNKNSATQFRSDVSKTLKRSIKEFESIFNTFDKNNITDEMYLRIRSLSNNLNRLFGALLQNTHSRRSLNITTNCNRILMKPLQKLYMQNVIKMSNLIKVLRCRLNSEAYYTIKAIHNGTTCIILSELIMEKCYMYQYITSLITDRLQSSINNTQLTEEDCKTILDQLFLSATKQTLITANAPTGFADILRMLYKFKKMINYENYVLQNTFLLPVQNKPNDLTKLNHLKKSIDFKITLQFPEERVYVKHFQ